MGVPVTGFFCRWGRISGRTETKTLGIRRVTNLGFEVGGPQGSGDGRPSISYRSKTVSEYTPYPFSELGKYLRRIIRPTPVTRVREDCVGYY